MMDKKGAARDVILIGVLLFSFAIGFFVIYSVFDTAVDKIVAIPAINQSNQTVEAFQSVTTNVTSRLDYVLFGLFIGLILALIITAWFIGGEPIFMFIYFAFVVVAVIISAVLANAWESFTGNAIFGLTIAAFPISNQLLTNLPLYIAIAGFVGVVAMFAKPYLSQD